MEFFRAAEDCGMCGHNQVCDIGGFGGRGKKEKMICTETDPAYAGDHEGRMPGNWETRKEDWDCVISKG